MEKIPELLENYPDFKEKTLEKTGEKVRGGSILYLQDLLTSVTNKR